MKRILLGAFILISCISFSQEKVTVSGNLNVSEPTQFGASIEWHSKEKTEGFNSSYILNVSKAGMKYDTNFISATGSGFVIESGHRTYYKKGKWSGFYGENFLSYGNIKFDETILMAKFEGTYSYWSIINPNIGYKIKFAKNFSIDPSIGMNWKWEVKGKGDIDNKNVDNLVFRAGIKFGYSF